MNTELNNCPHCGSHRVALRTAGAFQRGQCMNCFKHAAATFSVYDVQQTAARIRDFADNHVRKDHETEEWAEWLRAQADAVSVYADEIERLRADAARYPNLRGYCSSGRHQCEGHAG